MPDNSIVPYSGNSANVQPFNFNGQPLRVVVDQYNDPWFDGPDVCKALDLPNASTAYSRLDDDEKQPLRTIEGSPTQNGTDRIYISLAGLYSLILTSRKFEAKAFKRWVTHEVLPAIHKTGAYAVKTMTPAEIGLWHAQQLVNHERQIAELYQKVADTTTAVEDIKDRLDRDDWQTIRDYVNAQSKKGVTTALAINWGKAATLRSHELNMEIIKVKENGRVVNAYHKSVIAETDVTLLLNPVQPILKGLDE